MKNLPFVLWMVLYPAVCSLADYLAFLVGDRFSDGAKAFSALVNLVIWIYVGYKLYEKND